jgi:hypothetical protein
MGEWRGLFAIGSVVFFALFVFSFASPSMLRHWEPAGIVTGAVYWLGAAFGGSAWGGRAVLLTLATVCASCAFAGRT